MATYSEIQLHRGQGLTFAEIGVILGISKQRVHSIFTGYGRHYRTTETFKLYKTHYDKHAYPKDDCRYCQLDVQIGLQNNE